jgi:hypothetical protein
MMDPMMMMMTGFNPIESKEKCHDKRYKSGQNSVRRELRQYYYTTFVAFNIYSKVKWYT